MPIYEYMLKEGTCDECPGRFEARQRLSDQPLSACPRCHKPVQRVISAPAIHLPVTRSKLKETGMTRLVRKDRGVYEVEGADGGVLDFSQEFDQADAVEKVTTLDLSKEMGLEPDTPAAPPDGGTVPEGQSKKSSKKQVVLPFYDFITSNLSK